MKTKLLGRLATLVVALFVTTSVSTSWGQGTILYVNSGIINRYASEADYATVITALQNGTPQAGNWVYYPNGSTIPLTSIFNNGSEGGMSRVTLTAVDLTTKFTLAQIQLLVENSVFGSSSPSFTSFSNLGVGVDSGPDGQLGTTDDITYTSGNGNTPVNAVWLRGAGRTISIGNTPVDQALASWSDFTFERVTYTINGVSCSGQFNYTTVPEPSTAALFAIGLIGLRILKKKR